MRTGEGGRIHPQGFRARPILPGGAFSVNSVSFRKPPRPASAPAPSTLSHCFQDRKLYQKWGTNRMVYHPHCTDGKAEERGAAQGHRRIRSPKLSTPAWPGHPPPPPTCSASSGLHGTGEGGRGAPAGAGTYCWGCKSIISQTRDLALRPLWLRKQLMRL